MHAMNANATVSRDMILCPLFQEKLHRHDQIQAFLSQGHRNRRQRFRLADHAFHRIVERFMAGTALHPEGKHMAFAVDGEAQRSEENTSELQSLMSKSYADFCLKK